MDEHILRVADAIAEWTGIVVQKYHYPMLEYELTKLAGERGVKHSADLVLGGDTATRRKLIGVISNSETYLFRHWGHFEALRRCAGRRLAQGRPFTVLSAGCSSGEECWSAAATIASVYLVAGCDRFTVSGWDIDPERLSRARAGVYGAWATRKGLHGFDSYFEFAEDRWKVSDTLKRFVDFETVNLVDGEWPQTTRFDAIFFRNVSIYWDHKSVCDVRDRLAARLAEDGILLVGPSDPVAFDHDLWSVETGAGVPVVRRETAGANRRRLRKKIAPPVKPGPTVCRRRATPADAVKNPVAGARPEAVKKPGAELRMSDIEDLANKGRYEDALEALLSRGTALPPAQKLWEGILLLNLERFQEAIKVFRHCVFLEPEDPSYRRWLAAALDSAGCSPEAAREYRNARNIEVES
jgi:chemotaxis methyl-accepting protein methylase